MAADSHTSRRPAGRPAHERYLEMNTRFRRPLAFVACAALLPVPGGAKEKEKDSVAVGVFVNDPCIIAEEPFFLPVAPPKDGSDQATAKFLPLLGLVVGKLAELFINHEIQSSANHYKAGGARK